MEVGDCHANYGAYYRQGNTIRIAEDVRFPSPIADLDGSGWCSDLY